MLSQRTISVAVAFWAVGISAMQAADVEREAAQQTLLALGLTRVGDVWCVDAEVRLRTAIDGLDGREKRCAMSQKSVDQLLRQAEAAAGELRQAQEALKAWQARAKATTAGTVPRTAADDEVKRAQLVVAQARQKVGDPRAFGSLPPLKNACDELAKQRQELMLAILSIRQLAKGIDEQYQSVRSAEAAEKAMRVLGAPQRLGPVGNYERELRHVAGVESATLRAPVPITRDGAIFRVGAVLNEQTPATFSVHERSDPVLIPATLAEAAGIVAPPDAKTISIRPSPGRQLTARVVVMGQVRIGPWILRDVEAALLPPEGEDLGAQLNRDVLATRKISIDARKMVLHSRE